MNIILTIFMMLASASCSLDSLSLERYGVSSATNSMPEGRPGLPGETPEIKPVDPDEPKTYPNSYYVELRIKGESAVGGFKRYNSWSGDWVYAYGTDIEIKDTKEYVSYSATYNSGDGSSYYYGFASQDGNNFDILRYLKDEKLKTPYGSNRLNLYFWIKNMAHLFHRNDINIVIPVAQYDSRIHQNIARFTVIGRPDSYDKSSDLLIFDGFVPK